MKYLLASVVAISLTAGISHAGGLQIGGDTTNNLGGAGGAGGSANASASITGYTLGGSSATGCSYAVGPIAGPTKACNDIMRTNAVLDCLDQSGVKRTVCVKGLSKRSKFMRELLIEAGALIPAK